MNPTHPVHLIVPHLHRHCGGRLLRVVAPEGRSTVAYRCANCEATATSEPGELCWCGWQYGQNRMHCMAMGFASKDRTLADEMRSYGLHVPGDDDHENPLRLHQEVGIVSEDTWQNLHAFGLEENYPEPVWPTWEEVTRRYEDTAPFPRQKKGESYIQAHGRWQIRASNVLAAWRKVYVERLRFYLPEDEIGPTWVTWGLADHICRHCFGRMLRGVHGVGPTPGGDPIYRCASCGAFPPSHGEEACWCGHNPADASHPRVLHCWRYDRADADQALAKAFDLAGQEPARMKQKRAVGYVNMNVLRMLQKE